MRTFQDNAGRSWTVTLNVYAVKKVRDLLQVDLLDLGGDPSIGRGGLEAGDKPGNPSTGHGAGGLLYRLIADPVLLVDVLYVVCQEQADGASVTDEQFGRAMAGDAIDGATKAFLEELADFTPSPRDRARARKVIEATWNLIDRAQDVLDAKADGELAKAADAALLALSGLVPSPVEGVEGKALGAVSEHGESNRGSSSGNSPASSEPSPDP